jgi:hypothetical protein
MLSTTSPPPMRTTFTVLVAVLGFAAALAGPGDRPDPNHQLASGEGSVDVPTALKGARRHDGATTVEQIICARRLRAAGPSGTSEVLSHQCIHP